MGRIANLDVNAKAPAPEVTSAGASVKGDNISDKWERQESAILAFADFRFNEITRQTEIYAPPPRGDSAKIWRSVTDHDLNSIYRILTLNGFSISKDRIITIIESQAIPTVNPILSWFDKLPPRQTRRAFDAVYESLTLVNEHESATLKPLLWRWFTAMAGGVFGLSQNHVCLVLIGAQGIRKTSWLSALIPPELNGYWFTGKIDVSPAAKDSLGMLAEKWLINIDDQLVTLMGKDFEQLKSIFTLPDVETRAPYARFRVKRPRIASFAASVNDSEFLQDSQNRRYLCVEVKSCDVDKLKENRAMLWAEIKSALMAGERPYFDGTEERAIDQINARFQVVNEERTLLKSYCSVTPNDSLKEEVFVTTTQLLAWFKRRYPELNLTIWKLGRALKAGGYREATKRLKGGPVKGYILYCDYFDTAGFKLDK